MKDLYTRFKKAEIREKIIYIFVATIFIGMLAWIIQYIINVAFLGYGFFEGTSWGARDYDFWMDFYNVNGGSKVGTNPYTSGFRSSYPPLILAIARGISLLADYTTQRPIEVRETFMGAFSYHLVFVGATVLSVIAWNKLMKQKEWSAKLRACVNMALLFVAPYIYLYGRGNYVVLVVPCISWFILWYKSEKRWQRELALVLLAVAAGIKIYPALLAIILIKERRFADFFKTVIYTIAAFILPFLVFSGGFSNIGVFLKNLTSFQSSTQVSSRNFSMPTFLYYFVQFANGLKLSTVPDWVISVGGTLSSIILVCGLLFSLFSKQLWKSLAIVTIAVIVYPAPSFAYSATMLLPIILLFLMTEEKTKFDYVYLTLFLFLLMPLQFGYLVSPQIFVEGHGLPMNNCLQHFALIIIYCLLSCESITNIIRLCKNKIKPLLSK